MAVPPLPPPTSTPATTAPATTALPTSAATAPPIGDLLSRIEPATLRAHVRSLAELGSRYPGTDGHRQARLYLEQQLRRHGAGVVGRGPRGSGIVADNVFVAFGPGAAGVTYGDPIDIVLGAHYDSIADRTPGWRPESDPAPGANDNGTGVAGLLEIARMLAEEEKAGRLRRGVVVVFFDREETRMQGSFVWVGQPGGAGRVMLNLDMVGFSAPGRRKLDVVRYASSGDLLDRVRAANERYGLGLQLVDRLLPTDPSTWVDSTPFAMAGVPAVTLTESYGQPGFDYPGYPGFHRVSDTPDQINNEAQWRSAAQLVLALALELAR